MSNKGHQNILSRSPVNNDIRFDPDDDRPDYIGMNQLNGASTTANEAWILFKFTYTTSTASDIARVQKARGAWDNRVALFP